MLLLSAGSSPAQLNVWRWQNPLPEGNLLSSVQMISNNIIYACGDYATFMRTTDNGQTWDIQTRLFKSSKSLNCVSFINTNYGMCCGDSGKIIKTTDGGSTWKVLPTKTNVKLNSILVVDQNIAMAIAMDEGIFRTTDGGSTWVKFTDERNYALYSIKMLRPDFITITGYGGTLFKSIDTGRTWQPINSPFGNTYFSACFANDTTATVVADLGLLIRTTNGGATWEKEGIDSTIISATLNAVDGKDKNVLCIVGDYGTILYTTNAGDSWKESDIGTREHIKAISFFDKLNATAVGHDGVVLRTTNGGQDWFFLPHLPLTEVLYSVNFPKGDTSLGLTCGYAGVILRTTNGGQSWAPSISGTSLPLRGITFMDSMNAIAVGDRGTIIKSTDAGISWNPVLNVTPRNLYAVSFVTPNDGLIVGDSGVILRTYLAGDFWTKEFPTGGRDSDLLRSVSFPDIKHAFATGQHGYYISQDGGINWSYTPLIPKNAFLEVACYALSFCDSLHGGIIWGSGDTHTYNVYTTSDGGITWGPLANLKTAPLGIFCVDPLHATTVGLGGIITHTIDGGLTWNEQQSNTLNNLAAVCFGTLKAGTAVGYRGNIMRITTNEKFVSVEPQGLNQSQKIILGPNYPNPFSQSTTIPYNLPASGFTTVEIFSIDGKLMATLTNEFQIMGDHTLHFDAMGLASGTYIIRVMSDGMSASREIVVMK